MTTVVPSTLLTTNHTITQTQARPIAWEYDNALRLYPLPDVLILADNSYSFTHEYFGCQVCEKT